MMYGIQAAFEQQQKNEAAQFQALMEEARLRQIEMYRSMKQKYPDSDAVQQLCDKELARLEKETGA